MNFNQVEVQQVNQSKYLTPGVSVVKVASVTSGLSSAKQSPFVKITVEDANGATADTDFYLNGGAFTISANTFFKYIGVVYNLDLSKDADKTTIKAKLGEVANEEALATKLATLLVGKPFAMLLKGRWVNPADTTKKSWVKAELSNIVAPATKANTLTFDATKHITGTDASATVNDDVKTSTSVNW